jgi:hypothetical protein
MAQRTKIVALPRGRPPKDPAARKAYEATKLQLQELRQPTLIAGLPVVRRGRPPRDPAQRAVWLEAQAAAKAVRGVGGHMQGGNAGIPPYYTHTPATKPEKEETDAQILKRHVEGFRMLHDLVMSAAKGKVRSLVVSGGAGVGKTYTTEGVLTTARSKNQIRYEHVSGKITALELFKLLYQFRSPKDILLMDDSDQIFFQEDALNILKAALDTKDKRIISWRSNTLLLEDIPSKFTYEGGMIFISNIDFVRVTSGQPSRLSDHLKAVMSRSIYFDLRLHTPRELAIWVEHIIKTTQMLQHQRDLSTQMEKKAVEWIKDYRDQLREVSLRTALHIGTFMRDHTADWEAMAARTLTK